MSAAAIYDSLQRLSPAHLSELYQNEWCALAVFQSLDAISRVVIMRFVFQKGVAFSYSLLEQFVQPVPSSQAALRTTVDRLKQLHIFGVPSRGASGAVVGYDMNGPCDGDALVMNAFFQASLQRAISASSNTPWEAVTSALSPLRNVPSPVEVEQHATRKWNAILHFLVGTADAPIPSNAVIELLVSTGLLAPGTVADGDEDETRRKSAAGSGATSAEARALTFDEIMAQGGGAVCITRAGYEFLLRDTSVQLWTFMGAYLASAAARGLRDVDVLACLLELGFCRAGEGYALSALSEAQRRLVEEDFESFGLVYIPAGQDPLPRAAAEARVLSEARVAGAKLEDLTPEGALSAVVSTLLRVPALPETHSDHHASHPASPVRWLWPVLRSIRPGAGGDESVAPRHKAADASIALRTAAAAPLPAGWGLVEGEDADLPPLPTQATAVVQNVSSARASATAVPARVPVPAKSCVRDGATQRTYPLSLRAQPSRSDGRFTLLDPQQGSLLPELTWVPSRGTGSAMADSATGSAAPVPGAALSVLSAALQRLLGTHAQEEGQRLTPSSATTCRRFYPSSLAVLLTRPQREAALRAGPPAVAPLLGVGAAPAALSGAATADPAAPPRGWELQLVVEKNFKVYAYTAQDLHLALLALFCKIDLRLPNIVVATLTRRSVLEAMHKGISASLIEHFLRARVHPAAQGLGVPENVVDQLHLWEREQRRVVFQPAVLLTGFDTLTAFAAYSRYAGELGGALFDNASAVLASRQELLAAAAPPESTASAATGMTDVWAQREEGQPAGPPEAEETLVGRAVLVITKEQCEAVKHWVARRG